MTIIKTESNSCGIVLKKTCDCCGRQFSYIGPGEYEVNAIGAWFDCLCGSTLLASHGAFKDSAVDVPGKSYRATRRTIGKVSLQPSYEYIEDYSKI